MKQAINTFFDRVVVINLESRTDRHAEMREQLQRIGLSFESPGVALFQDVKPDALAVTRSPQVTRQGWAKVFRAKNKRDHHE